MLIKACQSLSTKNCHAKGRDLTLKIYCSCSDDRQVDRRSWKIFAVCLMLLQQNRSFFCWFTGSAAHARLVSRKFLEENSFVGTNFVSWCLIGKISALQQFPAIQYEVQWPDSDTLSLTWPLVFTSTPVLRRKTTSSRQPSPLAQISPSDSSSRGWCEETTQECNWTRLHMYRSRFAQSDIYYTVSLYTLNMYSWESLNIQTTVIWTFTYQNTPNKLYVLAAH